jgi:hypothetical protein
MRWMRTVLALFVDDARFAVAIIVWLGLTWLVPLRFVPAWSPAILFAGLAAILIESTFRKRRTSS